MSWRLVPSAVRTAEPASAFHLVPLRVARYLVLHACIVSFYKVLHPAPLGEQQQHHFREHVQPTNDIRVFDLETWERSDGMAAVAGHYTADAMHCQPSFRYEYVQFKRRKKNSFLSHPCPRRCAMLLELNRGVVIDTCI